MSSSGSGFYEVSSYLRSVEIPLPVAEMAERAVLKLSLASIGNMLCGLRPMPV